MQRPVYLLTGAAGSGAACKAPKVGDEQEACHATVHGVTKESDTAE